MTFSTLLGNDMNNFPFQPKAIQDEMGEAFEKDYGRMSGNLGLEVPLTQAGVAQNLILYPYVNPASEMINATDLPRTGTATGAGTGWAFTEVSVDPLSVATDGTQIWKITHNGVDTHPIHFHLFDVQLLNRVGWDGIIRKPDANELGWKDTVRISPLEDTIVALRPIIPMVPFDLPNSIRPLNPMMPLGSMMMFNSVDANANPTAQIVNELVNFGWEYVWHCHILSHEEMDMMRPISVGLPPKAPSVLMGSTSGNGNKTDAVLSWVDNSLTETGFIVRRALSLDGPWTDLATLPKDTTSYTYRIGRNPPAYVYQVFASNLVGYAGTPGYATMNLTAGSNTVIIGAAAAATPAAPTALQATVEAGPQVRLTWTDNATNETGFVVERALGAGAYAVVATINTADTSSYLDVSVSAGNTYSYKVAAVNSAGFSAYATTGSVSTAAAPSAPTSLSASTGLTKNQRNATVTLNWADVANETGYTIQVATDAAFTANVQTGSVGADSTSFTFGKLSRSTTYFLRVLAYNGSGPSAWSTSISVPTQ